MNSTQSPKQKKKGMSTTAAGAILCFIGAACIGSQIEGSGMYGAIFLLVGFVVAVIGRLKAD